MNVNNPAGKRILVVDDDRDTLDVLSVLLKKAEYEVITSSSGAAALKTIQVTFFPVILLDIHMPGMDGMLVLEKIKEESPQSLVIILTAYGSNENVQKASKDDIVFDFVEKPVDNKLLLLKIRKAFELADALLRSKQAQQEELEEYPYKNIIGTSRKIKETFKIIEKVAPVDACVLITGETGTGKELIARAIHASSKRSSQPFIPVNAGALAETLLETALFGHEKGAFTDAKERKFGYFESCKDGTIFLDEVGEISPKMQVNLLRVLQEKKIVRVGGTVEINVNTRLITATNRSLERLVEDGVFRQDLYFRIKTVMIQLPTLRERREDIPLLIDHFIKKYSNKPVKVSDEAMDLLMAYDYPGNIRELEHIIERALIFHEHNIIQRENLPPEVMGRTNDPGFTGIFKLPWEEAKSRFEQSYIENILARTQGNVSEAAAISGIDRSYLHKQIKKYGIKK